MDNFADGEERLGFAHEVSIVSFAKRVVGISLTWIDLNFQRLLCGRIHSMIFGRANVLGINFYHSHEITGFKCERAYRTDNRRE